MHAADLIATCHEILQVCAKAGGMQKSNDEVQTHFQIVTPQQVTLKPQKSLMVYMLLPL